MPGSLFDTSAWLAATFEQHPAHSVARRALREVTATHAAVFCRATQQSFLRLLSTAALKKAYGVEPLTNSESLVNLDKDFRNFLPQGLDLVLLSA